MISKIADLSLQVGGDSAINTPISKMRVIEMDEQRRTDQIHLRTGQLHILEKVNALLF
jgi:hypothetical protein